MGQIIISLASVCPFVIVMILTSFILTLLKPLILLVMLNSFINYRLMESLENYLNFYLIFCLIAFSVLFYQMEFLHTAQLPVEFPKVVF